MNDIMEARATIQHLRLIISQLRDQVKGLRKRLQQEQRKQRSK